MINELIAKGREMNATDLHLTCGEPPVYRINGDIMRGEGMAPLTPRELDEAAKYLVEASRLQYDEDRTDYDFCYVTPDGLRQRCNIYTQSGTRSAAIRLLSSKIPTMDSIGLPEIMKKIASYPRGLVLVTGPTGSGKTTTLAAMLDYINDRRCDHILTVEDPIEYVHTGRNCIISQREVEPDVGDFAAALRSALREDPDIILIGEMRDLETISAAITAAETGHLVLGTLHTTGASKTIDRIIDVFPPYQQQQVRTQLATVLRAVVSQTLLKRADGSGRVAAFETMIVNDAISNLIREQKTFQISSVMQTNRAGGMELMDQALSDLVKTGIVSEGDALDRAVNQTEFKRFLQMR